MKFELKTENDSSTNDFYFIFLTVVIISLLLITANISLKLGNIAKLYEINYYCRLLSVEKSASIFKKLSKLSNVSTKQKIWEFCREVVN